MFQTSFLYHFFSYLTYIKLCTLVKRNESMAHTLQAKLKEPEADESKRGPRPQDLIRLYDIILQVIFFLTLNMLWLFCVWCNLIIQLDGSCQMWWVDFDLCCQQWKEGYLTVFDRLCHLLLTAFLPLYTYLSHHVPKPLLSFLLSRVWLNSPPCRVWRMTTLSRRRCPSRHWSIRPIGQTFLFLTTLLEPPNQILYIR